jgi:hypothetical protein
MLAVERFEALQPLQAANASLLVLLFFLPAEGPASGALRLDCMDVDCFMCWIRCFAHLVHATRLRRRAFTLWYSRDAG